MSQKLVYAVVGLIVAAVVTFNVLQPIQVLPRARMAPGFAFTNHAGESRTSEDYRGKLTIYSFTPSRCGAGCPPIPDEMQALRKALVREAPADLSYALAIISLDPEHDTPEALRRHFDGYDTSEIVTAAGSTVSWDFLTGDPRRTKYVVGGGFGLFYERRDGTEPGIRFDPRYVVVDGWGVVRAEYLTPKLDLSRVMRDLDLLASEARHSTGVARLAYEAAHLFRCYP